MAIQPIDLQTMYSQMQNVARNVANAQFQPQLTQQMQEMNQIQQQQEQAKTIQRAANEESQTTDVNEDGRSDNQQPAGNGKKHEEQKDNTEPQKTHIREGYLGRHIDITR
ncbi:MAG: hypothetical protein IJP62_11990 [Treponema sp.]|nr:hypothetical protein [Treponema sp.]